MKFLKFILLAGIFGSSHAFAHTQIALTVDDLPSHGPLPPGVSRTDIAHKFIEVLKTNHVPEAYGFINAKKVDSSSQMDVLKIWSSAGFPLGNHSYSHRDLNLLTPQEFETELISNESVLKGLAGESNWHFFRYPFLHEGETLEKREKVRDILHTHGYKIAEVTIDFNDWQFNEPYTRCLIKNDQQKIVWLKKTYLMSALDQLKLQEQLGQALFGRSIKQVLLLHIGGFGAIMLDEVLKLYKSNDVEFITLAQANQDPIYDIDSKVVSKHGIEQTFQVMKSRNKTLASFGIIAPPPLPEREISEACQ